VAANAWLAKGDTRRGIEHLRRVVRLEPGDPASALRLGKLLLRNQRLGEATEVAERLAARYPAMSEVLALQGACYRQHPPESEKARRAEGAFVRALELDPLNGEAHAGLGLHQLVQGRPGPAVRYLEAAQLLNVRDVSLPFNLGRAYRALGRAREAAKAEAEFAARSRVETELMALEKRLATSPTDAITLNRLIELSSRINDPERAARYRRWAGVADTSAEGNAP
jgi:Flp pilus assembly protein TadD